MAQRLTAAMPRDFDLDSGYTLRVTALDPTTGSAIAQVKVSNVVIMALNLAGTPPDALAGGDWVLVPGPE